MLAAACASSRLGVQGEAVPQRPSHPDDSGGDEGPGRPRTGSGLLTVCLWPQLCYDYKFDFEDDQHKIPCHCGAVNCRKWMN